MQASFTVISGPYRGRTFQIPRGKFLLSRETDCHPVDANFVSRHHRVSVSNATRRCDGVAARNIRRLIFGQLALRSL
jgi:hypothetical protein